MTGTVSKDGKKLYVTNAGDATVTIIETATHKVLKTITAGAKGGMSLFFTPDEKLIWLTGGEENLVVGINPATDEKAFTIPLDSEPHDIVQSPDENTLYVTSRDQVKLLVVSTGDLKVVAEVPVGKAPHEVAYRK